MPFRSEAQRRFMYATDPQMAKKWEAETPKGVALPDHVSRSEHSKRAQEMFDTFLVKSAANYSEPEREFDLTFSPEDLHIHKYAGINIYDSTPEGVEQFVRNYVTNELAFFPQKLGIEVQFMPEVDAASPDEVVNGTGTVLIKYAGATIELPFMVRDKELVPFDIIQMGNERAVYTRDNIRRVLMGLQATANSGTPTVGQQQQASPMQSMLGVAGRQNNTTDHGYMQDVLRVQEQASNASGYGGNWVSASEAIDGVLDKVANIQKVDIDYNALRVRITNDIKKDLRKLAEVEEESGLQDALVKVAVFDRVSDMRFVNIHHLGNGAHIKYPEKDGSSFSMTNATVFKGIYDFDSVDESRCIVLSHDGRFADIGIFSPFIGISTENQTLNKAVPSNGLKNDNMYIINIDGVASAPFYVETMVMSKSKFDLMMSFVYECVSIDGKKFSIVDMQNPSSKLLKFTKERFIKEVRKAEHPEKIRYYEAILKKDKPLFVIPPNVDIYHIKGHIDNYMSNPRDLLYMYDDNFLKTASLQDYASLTLNSGADPKQYTLEIAWTDKRSSSYQTKKKNFTSVPESRVRGILKAVGFSFNETAEIINRANKEGKGILPLTAQHTPWLVREDVAAPSMADNFISNLKKNLFNKEYAGELLGGVIGGGIGDTLGPDSSAHGLASWASESEALTSKLEKIAILKESDGILKVAKLMAIKHNVDRVLHDTLTKNAEYAGVHEVLASLPELMPAIQETANELIQLKVAQYLNNHEIISPNVIQATVAHLDGLSKYANYGMGYVDDNYQYQQPGPLDKAVDFVKQHPFVTAGIGVAGFHGARKLKQAMVPPPPPTLGQKLYNGAAKVTKGALAFGGIPLVGGGIYAAYKLGQGGAPFDVSF